MKDDKLKIDLIPPREITKEDLDRWGVWKVEKMTREELERKFPSRPKRS